MDADEAAEAEHHVEKAARTEEPSARVTPQGQALLQACSRLPHSLRPAADSVRDSCMLTLSLRQVPSFCLLSLGLPNNFVGCQERAAAQVLPESQHMAEFHLKPGSLLFKFQPSTVLRKGPSHPHVEMWILH